MKYYHKEPYLEIEKMLTFFLDMTKLLILKEK